MIKFGFCIKTRGGMTVENLSVQAKTREDAEARIRQIYQNCEILECQESAAAGELRGGADFENVITLISRQDDSK